MKKIVLLLMFSLMFISCTDNSRAKHWGGTEVVKLPDNCVFINSTWKESNLWIMVKDTTTNTFFMYEKSQFGVMEGRIEFK